ncbi:hypothetical protein [Pygmaiobacter massiliensis]|uniref:hypothetical protein n=1 Tax=Pygmaiobacter massiliensis TaxID=1917873 RepID=UPI003899FEB2
MTATRPVWICATFNTYGKSTCASKQIPEETLLAATTELLGLNSFDEAAFHDRIAKIIVHSGNRLEFRFKDGAVANSIWKDRSRSESWTDEMKNEARRKKLCRE